MHFGRLKKKTAGSWRLSRESFFGQSILNLKFEIAIQMLLHQLKPFAAVGE